MLVALSPLSWACPQKRKRDCSSESGEMPCGLKRKMKRKHLCSVLPVYHEAFTRLLEDPVIKIFLAWDENLRASDKYLLAMVIAYFSRAGLFPRKYQRIQFFLALSKRMTLHSGCGAEIAP
uniref:Speedy protein E4-like n=1 Tax=Cavia porcellus TaxID=10141 RepID=A0A286XZN4_CAVPO